MYVMLDYNSVPVIAVGFFVDLKHCHGYLPFTPALPIPVVTFSGSPGNAMLNQMYTLTCSVEVVEGLAVTPVVTWMNADNTPVTGSMGEQETIGTVTTRNLVFSPLSEADLREFICEGCVTISKVFIDEHCGQTRPCIAIESECLLMLRYTGIRMALHMFV